MKRLLAILCTLLVSAPFAAALHHGDGSGDGFGSGWDGEIPQEILDIRAELNVLKEDLHSDREDLLATLVDATDEERLAALSEWREAHEADFAAIHELASQLRALVEEYRPDMHFEIPPEIQQKREELRTMRQELAQSRRATIGALEDPTDEEIRAAVQAWKTENADAITAAQELAQEIRQWFRENRPHRPPPEGLHAMHQRRLQFKDNMVQVHDIRQQMEALDPDSDEYAALREQLRELMRDRKRYMRKRRSDEGGVGGDRRPGG